MGRLPLRLRADKVVKRLPDGRRDVDETRDHGTGVGDRSAHDAGGDLFGQPVAITAL